MDRARFVELATAEWRVIFRFALRLTRDRDRAEDLVQDVYTQALRPERIDAFEPRRGGLRAWLLRITYRAFLSSVERSQRESTLFRPLDSGDESASAVLPQAQRARDFDWDGVDERIKDVVGQLDPGSREVLMLWAIERLQYQEIAEVLDIPMGTVMSRLHRARGKLSTALLADASAVEDLQLREFARPATESTHGGEA